MWEAIKDILNGSNSIQTLSFLLAVIILAFTLVKMNFLRVQTPHLKIGTDEKERAVIRQQIEWAYNYINGLYGIISTQYPYLEPLKTKYVLECIYDEVVNWISFNHITRSDMYIMVKQEKICGLVFSMDVNADLKSDKFRDFMNGWTREIINRLVDIREYYSK